MLLCLSRITEAFVMADEELHLSGDIKDPKAYTKLTGL